MGRPRVWLIVKRGSGPEIQISTSTGRRKAKGSSVCIESKIGKNDIYSQVINLIKLP